MENISIIIPVCNRASIVSATLDSIISQSYDNWECIIVDDFSQDNIKSVINNYTNQDSRFVFLANERKKGAQGARNTGIMHSHFEWLLFFDSDNIMHPNMLEKLTAAISNQIDIIQCFSNIIDANTGLQIGVHNWVSEGNIHHDLFSAKTYVDFNQSIVRKANLIQIGLLDEDCPSMQEWDTHIMLSNVSTYKTIKEPLIDYYANYTDSISSNSIKEVAGRMYVLHKYLSDWNLNIENKQNFILDIYARIRHIQSKKYKIMMLWQLKQLAPPLPKSIIYLTIHYWFCRIKIKVKGIV